VGNQAVRNKPTAAFVLSLVGGILGIVAGIVLLVLAAVTAAASSYYYYRDYTGANLLSGFGIWVIVCSIIVIVAAAKLNSNPLDHTKWGVVILVFSIIEGINILGLVGGILALIFNPKPARYLPPPPMLSATTTCPQCGRVVDEYMRFCMYCGRRLF
jgi:uncharacterized membrane protein HdeD (DUF308 family)